MIRTDLAVSKSFKNGFKTGDSHKLQSILRDALFLSVGSTDDVRLPKGDIEPEYIMNIDTKYRNTTQTK